METFSTLLALCEGNSPVTGEFPSQRPVTRSFDVFFGLRLNKCLSKPSRRWWFETPSCSLWRHSNDGLVPNTWQIITCTDDVTYNCHIIHVIRHEWMKLSTKLKFGISWSGCFLYYMFCGNFIMTTSVLLWFFSKFIWRMLFPESDGQSVWHITFSKYAVMPIISAGESLYSIAI